MKRGPASPVACRVNADRLRDRSCLIVGPSNFRTSAPGEFDSTERGTASMTSETSSSAPVLVMELNGLSPPIIDKMMAAGELPNFKRLHAKSDVHVTWTDDEDLEPWVQWVTLHTGKTQTVHGAKELDEGYRVDLPRVWDTLGDRGVASLIF